MSKWSPWDWIAYTCLGVAAGGAAISALPKETRAVFEGWSSLFTSPKWSFVPAIFFIIATVIFIGRMLLPQAKTAESKVEIRGATTPENIDQKISQWIDASHLLHRMLRDDKIHLGFGVSIPPRFFVTIVRPKDRPSYLTLTSKIGLRGKQPALLDAMSEEKKMGVYREIRKECAKSKIMIHMHKNLDVWVQKQILVTPDLNEARFIDSINGMYSDATVVMDTIDGLIPPPIEPSKIMDATRSIAVAKVVDETVRIVRNNPAKQTFTLPAFREAGAGTLETEEELQAAREGVRQHNIRDPLAGLDVLWFGTEQPPKWLAVIQLANQKQVLLTHQAEVLDFVNEHFVKPPS